MAYLTPRGNVWQARWTQNGVEVRRSTGVHVKPGKGEKMSSSQLKKLAQAAADSMEYAAAGLLSLEAAIAAVRAAAGTGQKKSVTINAFFDGLDCKKYEQKHTIDTWRRFCPDFCQLPISSFTCEHVKRFFEILLDVYNPLTVRKLASFSKQLFKRAVELKYITKNPFVDAKLPSAVQGTTFNREIFTPEEIKKMMDFPGEWPDMVLVCLLLGGQRLGDIANLQWQQVDWATGVITFRAQKTKRMLRKPLTPQLTAILQRREKMYGETVQYVFPFAAASFMHAGGTCRLSSQFCYYCEKAGIIPPPAHAEPGTRKTHKRAKSFHSLRATAVTYLLSAGVPSELVRHIVGHDTTEIERKYYFKPALALEAEQIVKLGAALLPGGGAGETGTEDTAPT